MKHRLLSLLLALPLSVSCVKTTGGALTVEKIDFAGFEERPFSEYLSEHVADVSALGVDTSRQYRLGQIDRALFTDSEILLRDIRMQKIVAVSRADGRGLASVGSLGRANNEYLQVSGFDRDASGNIWILDARSKKVLEYDGATYAFLGSHPLEKITPVDIKCLGDGWFMFFRYPDGDDWQFQLQAYSDGFVQKDGAVPGLKSFDPAGILSSCSFNPADGSSFYSSNVFIDDRVTLLDGNGGIVKQFAFDFGKYRFPDDLRASISSHPEELARYRCACAPVFITKGKAGGKLFDRTALSFFLADREKEILYLPGDVFGQMTLIYCDNDMMAFFLPSGMDVPQLRAFCPDLDHTDYVLMLRL